MDAENRNGVVIPTHEGAGATLEALPRSLPGRHRFADQGLSPVEVGCRTGLIAERRAILSEACQSQPIWSQSHTGRLKGDSQMLDTRNKDKVAQGVCGFSQEVTPAKPLTSCTGLV